MPIFKFFTTLLLMISILEAGTYSGGAGTESAPYQISNMDDLIELSQNSADWSEYFYQTTSITFPEDETSVDWDDDGSADGVGTSGFSPIGNSSTPFTGNYDGGEKTINYLYIARSTYPLGMFGRSEDAVIENLGLLNVSVACSNYLHGSVGGLVGNARTNSGNNSISNCYVTGSASGNMYVGGLVGEQTGADALITDCHSNANVTVGGYHGSYAGGLVGYNNAGYIDNSFANSGTISYSSGSGDYMGGLVGANISGTINECYGDCPVTGNSNIGGLVGYSNYGTIKISFSAGAVSGTAAVGGLVGFSNNSLLIQNCYSTGNVTRSSGTAESVAGFLGQDDDGTTISYAYSTGSVFSSEGNAWGSGDGYSSDQGFIGIEDGNGTYTANFFDSEASNQSTDAGGAAVAKTTAEMTTDALTYNYSTNIYLAGGWDFKGETTNGSESIWNIGNSRNDGYPYFDWRFSSDDASLPVTLSSFDLKSEYGSVQLNWTTSSELENLGFILERRGSGDPWSVEGWEEIASYLSLEALRGRGSTTLEHHYAYIDVEVEIGKSYWYRLSDVSYTGKVTVHPIQEITVRSQGGKVLPHGFKLISTYPNPFNPTTTIQYELTQTAPVLIRVFDVNGQLVSVLSDEVVDAGEHQVVWNGRDAQNQIISTGVYLAQMHVGQQTQVIKLTYLK